MELKEVVKKAKSDFVEVFGEHEDLRDLRLEEIQRDGPVWSVTFSYLVADRNPEVGGIATVLQPTTKFVRLYKVDKFYYATRSEKRTA